MEIIRMLSGTFTNREQINKEDYEGRRVHLSGYKHIITPCGHLISNIPEELERRLVAKRATDMGDRIIDKHYLFLYEDVDEKTVRLYIL